MRFSGRCRVDQPASRDAVELTTQAASQKSIAWLHHSTDDILTDRNYIRIDLYKLRLKLWLLRALDVVGGAIGI
ncbi:hypothetical protein [Nonomuraea sp. NPDC001699]